MTEDFLSEIRLAENLKNAILKGIVLESSTQNVTVKIITDRTFTENDRKAAWGVARRYIPREFGCRVEISKLTPDCDMIARKILEAVESGSKAVAVTLTNEDIKVEKSSNGFNYTLRVLSALGDVGELCDYVNGYLKKNFCGEFYGHCVESSKTADALEVEEEQENVEFEMPVRKFRIDKFDFLEGTEKQETAVYISDLNFASEKVIICGVIEDIRERTYISRNQEKIYYSFTINDNTATTRVTYFTRQKSLEKVSALKVGDSIVCTGKTESYNGYIRFTANTIDYGSYPDGFVPEKRVSKPVPQYYINVKPQPYSDISQQDMFSKVYIPECLKGRTFVVFDLETTGLNSSPASGNMDKIIEIGGYKVRDGVISESFSTFINPQKKLSEEIIKLTGITDEMVADAPTYEQVMPDFFKFCDGAVLVGHNIAGFDFKFVDYYCAKLGYMFERKIIDTIPLSQELLFLSNYKLNTVADKFGITFNHHRAVDDALVTAKIFIELIKIKKSLPNMQ